MTEEEWMECADPQRMLEFLRDTASERKLRLFAVTCARRIIHLFNTESFHRAIDVAERYVDGMAQEAELSAAYAEVNPDRTFASLDHSNAVCYAVAMVVSPHPILWSPSHCVAHALQFDAFQKATTIGVRHLPPGFKRAEYAAQANLLRCIMGNPSLPVTLVPSWLLWNSGIIRSIAQAIYEERAFDRLPILADALEEAGCSDPGILNHCRQPGEHVRGCWVVDALLGKI